MIGSAWTKHGIVFSPINDANSISNSTEALVPTPIYIKERDVIRVYYTVRDHDGLGNVHWVEFSANAPDAILSFSTKPVLSPGRPGFFDDNGVMATSILKVGDVYYLYYVGFEIPTKIRYRLLSGLAISNDGGNTFQRFSTQPILERTTDEPFFRGGPFVSFEKDKFKMWYVGGGDWLTQGNVTTPKYALKYLESEDGMHWANKSKLILEPSKEGYAIGRPWVIKEGSNLRIYYSERKTAYLKYRLENVLIDPSNFAKVESTPQLNLTVGPEDFDSEEICYGAVIKIKNRQYMYYNGNNLGESGIALASMELDV